ncbi:MAG: transcription elongation factor GreA [Clostridiaceae bacterium]|jgi:transcription elongation factor GreA|nr:transcription elongation factor GreA [Clostridiaceae bacterium]
MAEIYLTQEGYDKLQKRLDYLLAHGRKEIAEKIKIAREFGDLSENAEYDAAKEEQVFIEQEIKEIDEKLRHAVIIDESALDASVISVGSTVTVYDREFEEEIVYRIVGTSETDLTSNKISNESPLGKSLLGKKKGDVVSVKSPQGEIHFQILKIHA